MNEAVEAVEAVAEAGEKRRSGGGGEGADNLARCSGCVALVIFSIRLEAWIGGGLLVGPLTLKRAFATRQ